MPKLRIAIVTCDRLDATKRCLESVDKMTACDYRLSVVDNGSKEDTISYLVSLCDKKKINDLYLFGKNMGVACGYNLALSLSDVRLDNDIVIKDPSWANIMIDFLSQYKEIATIGFHVWNKCPDESVHGLGGYVAFIARSFTTGACCMLRKDTHARLGFWCEDYGLYGEEDKDFGFRVYESGMLAGYVDKKGKYIYHEHVPHTVKEIENLRCDGNRVKSLRMFLLNKMLYKNKKRGLYMPKKYDYAVNGLKVSVKLNKNYSEMIKEIYKIGVGLEPELKKQLQEKYNISY